MNRSPITGLRPSTRNTLVALLALSIGTAANAAGQVFVSSEKDNKLYVFSPAGERLGEIATCERPRHMLPSLDKKTLYVCCGNSNELGVVDIASRKLVKKVPLGDSPEIFDFKQDQSVVYVSIEEENVMAAYDMATSKRLFSVPTAGEPEGIYVTPDDRTAYVTSEVGNLVHVVDLSSRKVIKDLKVGKRPRRFTPTADAKELWVSNELSNSVSIIDTATQTVKETIRFSVKGVRDSEVQPVGMVLSKDGKTMWVALGHARQVAAVDVTSRKVTQLVLAGKRAWNVDLSTDGKTLYVVNGLSDDMTLIDVSGSTAKPIKTVAAGRVPHSVYVSP